MLYGNYRFNCRFEGDAELPVFKGSTFRGVFGHALKRVVCALKRQECPDCILRERCLYTRVFETPLAQGGKEASRNSPIPHPSSSNRRWRPGPITPRAKHSSAA